MKTLESQLQESISKMSETEFLNLWEELKDFNEIGPIAIYNFDKEPKNYKRNIIKEKVKENVNDLIENLQSTLEIIRDINDNSGLGNEIIDLYQKLSDFNKKLEKI